MTGFPRGSATIVAVSLFASTALAAPSETIAAFAGGSIITPASSQPMAGRFAHTNIHILLPNGRMSRHSSSPSGIYETPASLACLYRQVKPVTGCNPETLTAVAQGGSKVIVLVDAYDDPTAAADLATFSKQFGLPVITSKNFKVVYAGGSRPLQDGTGGWELEESLDIQMAHSLAPNAKIVLVEANTSDLDDLMAAETVAAGIAAQAGGGEVSNSFITGEFSGEEDYESVFTGTNVVFFASAGDIPGTGMPATLSNVVSVGGTQINRDDNGNFLSQSIWSATGGGYSLGVPLPPYQAAIASVVHHVRGIPDVALVASPTSGVWIYDSTPYQGEALDWLVIGGTSVASPAVAAIVNSAKSFAASSVAELTTMYGNLGDRTEFTDIKAGECSNGFHLFGWKGWDPCTGIGTPRGRKGE